MARPTRLLDAAGVLIAALEAGDGIGVACDRAGISRETYRLWLKRAESGDELFVAFRDRAVDAEKKGARVRLGRALDVIRGVPVSYRSASAL